MIEKDIKAAASQFEEMLREQYERNERIKRAAEESVSLADKDTIVIGMTPGDGIGPVIMDETRQVLETLLADKLASGAVSLKTIDGFTLERRLETGETVP